MAALNARLMRHCACQCGAEGEIASMCEEHSHLIDVARHNERERCAKIVDNLARMVGQPYVDPLPQFNTPGAIQELHKTLAETAAEAIRSPV